MKTLYRDNVRIDVIDNPNSLFKFLDWLSAERNKAGDTPFALDFETTSLFPEEGRVRLSQFCLKPGRVYIVDHDKTAAFKDVAQLIVDCGPYYAFNINFEGRWCDYHTVTEDVTLHDVGHMRRAVMGGGPLKLSTMVKWDLGITLDKDLQNSDWSAPDLSDEQYEYAGLDAHYTKQLGDDWRAQMTDAQYNGFLVINDAWRAINECYDTGMKIDVAYHKSLIKMWTHRRNAAEASFRKFVPESIMPNIRSKIQFSNMLRQILDDDAIAQWPKTDKTGQLQSDRKLLREMSYYAPYPFSRMLAAYMVFNRADKYLSTYGENLLNKQDLSADGRLRGRLNPAAAVTGRFSSSNPNCFTGDHELLTPNGWVRCDAYNGQPIMQWWPNGKLSYTVPSQWVAYEYDGPVVQIDAAMVSAVTTPDHRFIGVRQSGYLKEVTAAELAASSGLDGVPTCGQFTAKSYSPVTPKMARLAVAISADGTVRKNGAVEFCFKKERKIIRLKRLLDACGFTYKTRRPYGDPYDRTHFYVHPDFRLPKKGFGPWVLNLSLAAAKAAIDELRYWDGWTVPKTGKMAFCTVLKDQAEWVHTLLCINNVPATMKEYVGQHTSTGFIYHVTCRKSRYSTVDTERQVRYRQHSGMVYCPTVSSSYVLVRHRNRIYVAGQCQNIPRSPVVRRSFVAGKNRKLILADYSGIEVRVLAEMSGDQILLHDAIFGDVHAQSAIVIYKEDEKSFLSLIEKKDARAKEKRSKAKGFTFQLTYGAGTGALAIVLRTSVEGAADAVKAWANRYQKAYQLRFYMQEKMNHDGFLPCASGRTIFVPKRERSLPVASNYPIQGSAGDVMYRAMYHVRRLLIERGISAWMMNSIHDELLLLADDDEENTAAACAALEEGMKLGWLDIFPNTSTENLIEAVVGDTWADKA